jgi:hypothetical protein
MRSAGCAVSGSCTNRGHRGVTGSCRTPVRHIREFVTKNPYRHPCPPHTWPRLTLLGKSKRLEKPLVTSVKPHHGGIWGSRSHGDCWRTPKSWEFQPVDNVFAPTTAGRGAFRSPVPSGILWYNAWRRVMEPGGRHGARRLLSLRLRQHGLNARRLSREGQKSTWSNGWAARNHHLAVNHGPYDVDKAERGL